MHNKFAKLVDRLQKLGLHHPFSDPGGVQVKRGLGVTLPEDYLKINAISSYERMHFFRVYNFDLQDPTTTSIDMTLKLRKDLRLPHNYIAISMDSVGVILVRVPASASEEIALFSNHNLKGSDFSLPYPEDPNIVSAKAEVILCSHHDLKRIGLGMPYEENPMIFPDYLDFYDFLLDQEEEISKQFPYGIQIARYSFGLFGWDQQNTNGNKKLTNSAKLKDQDTLNKPQC